jgi:YesN/AraC family two-component response regulator
MRLFIENMSTLRCRQRLDAELTKRGFPHLPVQMGYVDLLVDIIAEQEQELQVCFEQCKLALIKRKALIMVERIKHAIYDMINAEKSPGHKTSAYLSDKCKANYNYLSNVFKQETGETISDFFNKMSIEKAKELISYGEHNLTDIAYILHYSSVAYFSSQFKKITGMTPSAYRQSVHQERDGLENL